MPPEKLRLIIAVLYAAISLVVFGVYGLDKKRAEKGKWRIPERTLIGLAVLSPGGALLGMIVFRHKIRNPKFYVGVPLMLVLELASFILAIQ